MNTKTVGVSSCATCDGFFFKNQRVAVIGGGDSAMEEALFLARICTSVKLIHRRDKFSATPLLVDQVLENPKIEVIWDSVVEEFYSHNNDMLSHVIVKNVHTGELRDLEVEGAFVAIGHKPSTELFEVQRPEWSQLSDEERQAAMLLNLTSNDWPPLPQPGTVVELDSDGYIITERQSTATTVPGIFAAGDVSDNVCVCHTPTRAQLPLCLALSWHPCEMFAVLVDGAGTRLSLWALVVMQVPSSYHFSWQWRNGCAGCRALAMQTGMLMAGMFAGPTTAITGVGVSYRLISHSTVD